MRFSAIHQGRGSTLERQTELIEDWFNCHQVIERSKLSSVDYGKSGYTGKDQHELGKIRDAIDAGLISAGDYILVEAIDRIGRMQPLKMIELITSIVNKGVIIVTLEDNHEYSQDTLNTNASSLYILAGKVQQAHDYSKQLSRRITKAYERKRREARDGKGAALNTPIWLDKGNVLVPDKAKMVLECIDLYLKGYGTRRIVLDLLPKYPHLKSVHPTTLKRWFKNRVLIGEWETIEGVIPNVFKPLIDTTLFYKLQKELKHRTKKMSPEKTYELSGIVVCACCKKSFHFQRKKYKDYVIIYANCSNYLKRGLPFCTNKKTWPYEVLMHIYEDTYSESMQTVAEAKLDTIRSEDLDTLKAQLAESMESYNNLMKLYERSTTIVLEDRLVSLSEEQKVLKAKVSELEIKLEDDIGYTTEESFAMHNLISQLGIDPIQKRDVLLKSGYQIPIEGSQITIRGGRYESQTYTLIRRSTKHNCYLVEHEYPETNFESYKANDAIEQISSGVNKLAISRSGLVAYAPASGDISWEQFLKDFTKYKLED